FSVGTQTGGLYLFNSSLNPVASYSGPGSAINTTPAVDGAGDWYVGADDGYVHEFQNQGGQMVQVNRYGSMGTVGSSVQVGGCAIGGPLRGASGPVPSGAGAGGKVSDPGAVARALRPLLARAEITQTHAFVAASDSVATFRILRFAASSSARDVDAAIARELPFDPQLMSTRWMDLGDAQGEQRAVYAAAWDRAMVKNLTEAIKLAGLEPVVLELKSASVARAVPAPACVVLDLASDPAEI